VPLLAALVQRATMPDAGFGLSEPFRGAGRDAPLTDALAAALYVRVNDAGVSATSQKVLFSNLNLHALRAASGAPPPDASLLPLGKTGLFAFSKHVTSLATSTSAAPARGENAAPVAAKRAVQA
jgi:hypothetical protein